MRSTLITGMVLAICIAALPSLAADAGAGEQIFGRCKACHTAEQESNKVGPSLKGVVGRVAGTYPEYRYSSAMVEAGKGGLVWDEAAIAKYVWSPRGFVPGNKMAFGGLKSDEDIANLVAYLKQFP